MKTKTVVESNTNELEGHDFLFFHDDDNGFFINDAESIKEAMKKYGDKFPEMFIADVSRALNFLAGSVVDAVGNDLEDIWKRLDRIENK